MNSSYRNNCIENHATLCRHYQFKHLSYLSSRLTSQKIKMFWIPLTITIFALYWLVIANIKNPQPINGIYSQPGPFYWLKYWSFCLLMSLQRLRKSKQKVNNIEDLEKPILFEADNLLGNDSVFFIGSCVKSGLTFIVSTERRPQNVTYALVYVVVSMSKWSN